MAAFVVELRCKFSGALFGSGRPRRGPSGALFGAFWDSSFLDINCPTDTNFFGVVVWIREDPLTPDLRGSLLDEVELSALEVVFNRSGGPVGAVRRLGAT